MTETSLPAHSVRGRFRGTTVWTACALAALTIAVFAPVRTFDFVSFDDPWYVSRNPHVVTGLTLRGVWWAFTSGHLFYWQPLTWLSHMIDVELFGLKAGGHHVTSLLLHLASTLTLFALLRKMTGAAGRSAFVAALFAVHPLRVESVAWVAERKDVLSTLFCLLAVWAYVGYVRRTPAPGSRPADTTDGSQGLFASWRSRGYVLVLLLFALALMAKPMVVTLPIMLLLIDIWPLGRLGAPLDQPVRRVRHAGAVGALRRAQSVAGVSDDATGVVVAARRYTFMQLLAEKLPLIALAAASALATFVVQARVGAVGNLQVLPLDYRLANAVVSYVAYLRMMVWPEHLAVFYPYPSTLPAWPLVAGCAAGLVLVTVAALRLRRAAPYLLTGWFWYLTTLFPVIGLFQAGDQLRADRFTYVPLIGIFLMIAWGVGDLVGRRPFWRRTAACAALLVVVACGTVARGQVLHWRNSETLWKRALAVTDGNHRAHASLAELRAEQGKVDEAIAEYKEALRILPGVAEWRNALGLLYLRQGRLAESVGQFAIAVRLQPAFADARTNLGAVLARVGHIKEAIAQYEEAARLTPDDPPTRFNLSLVLQADHRTDEALAQCLLALRLDPSQADWQYQAAVLFSRKGNSAETRRHLEEALRLDPNHKAARRALEAIAGQHQ